MGAAVDLSVSVNDEWVVIGVGEWVVIGVGVCVFIGVGEWVVIGVDEWVVMGEKGSRFTKNEMWEENMSWSRSESESESAFELNAGSRWKVRNY